MCVKTSTKHELLMHKGNLYLERAAPPHLRQNHDPLSEALPVIMTDVAAPLKVSEGLSVTTSDGCKPFLVTEGHPVMTIDGSTPSEIAGSSVSTNTKHGIIHNKG